ncbi:hypothetical protein F511_41606 [Dorcoceras hygrometricum]|uniref:Uncharacterized protein n=1 Tax=Dorcoceras hygrometricum TaxID=472368 RepID=A0A2Z7BMK9_9LAMI|nr:hypothetical protein F511_41606 [Dorcoceras hygrometricum]
MIISFMEKCDATSWTRKRTKTKRRGQLRNSMQEHGRGRGRRRRRGQQRNTAFKIMDKDEDEDEDEVNRGTQHARSLQQISFRVPTEGAKSGDHYAQVDI